MQRGVSGAEMPMPVSEAIEEHLPLKQKIPLRPSLGQKIRARIRGRN